MEDWVQEWRVPGYRVVRELLPRGSGRSMLALHEASGLPVTLRLSDPTDSLRADARALAELSSPHLATLYEHIEMAIDGHHSAVTVREYIEGASVRTLLPRLAHESSLALLRSGLLALAAAHDRGITHRAYTASNVLVDAHGFGRVTDFATVPPLPSAPDEPTGYREDDVRAAFAVFVECVVGRAGGAEKLPRRLRGLVEPAVAGDGAALLDAVERAGGREWLPRAERELARLVSKVR